MKLTLLRHGDTAGSRDDLYYGAADIPVLPDSLEMLAQRAKTGVYPTAARYYTSGLLRTEQTIRALYGDVPHTQLPGLREMDFGDFEMKSYAELKDDPAFQTWCQDAEHNACPHGESAPQVLARNLAALQPVLDAGEDAVCVIHGGVTAGLLMHWFGGIRYDYPVAPGTGYQVTFEGGKPVSYRPVPSRNIVRKMRRAVPAAFLLPHQLTSGGVFRVDVGQLLFTVNIRLIDAVHAAAAGVAAAVAAVAAGAAGTERPPHDLLTLCAGGVLDEQRLHGVHLLCYPAMASIFSMRIP